MVLLFFCISLVSSVIGAISGIGGGILSKPALDATHQLNLATINFLSGTTVLVMATVSLILGSKDSTRINVKISSMLGLGAALGGVAGKALFDLAFDTTSHENELGAFQSILLLLITVGIFFYLRYKERIPTKKIQTIFPAMFIGLILGMISAFLGIGGGPMNIALLYFFFSMEGKDAARNSLFVVFISQLASLASTLLQQRVPGFSPYELLSLLIGCIAGALIGSAFSRRMTNRQVERFFSFLLVFVAMVNIYNFIRFVN